MMLHRLKPPLLFIEEKSKQQTIVGGQPFYYSRADSEQKQADETDTEITSSETEQQSEDDPTDLDDKLKHINRLLLTIPQLNSEIITEEKSFRGIIQEISEDFILLKPRNSPTIKISKKIIQDIRMVGL